MTNWEEQFKKASEVYRAQNKRMKAEANFGADFGTNYNGNSGVLTLVQSKLNSLRMAIPPLQVDGRIGPATIAAIKRFQTSKGLVSDGVVGDQTLAALGITPTASVPSSTSGGDPSIFSSLVDFAKKYGQTVVQASGVAPGFQATRASVVQSFVPWSSPLEGYLNYMYPDSLGYITTGMGNKIDPIGDALGMPWQHADGSPASQSEVQAEWQKMKNAYPGIQSTKARSIATLFLPKDYIEKSLIPGKMKANESYILAHMPAYASLPADAQLASMSLSWAMGTGWTAGKYPQLVNAINAGDFTEAAAQSHMQGNGIDMRNLANKLLFLNAGAVKALGLNPDHLYYLDGIQFLKGVSDVSDFLASPITAPIAASYAVAKKIGPGWTAALAAAVTAVAYAVFGRRRR